VTLWVWVRHGPTHERAFTGWRDVPADLSDRAGLDRLSAALPADAAVVSSDLIRAAATADAIAGGRARWENAAALREFDFGRWDGMDFVAAAARDPDLARLFWEAPGAARAPDGDSWDDVAARAGAFVDAVNVRGIAAVIAVAHMGVILTQLARATGAAPADVLAQPIEPLSLTELAWDGRGWTVGRVNHRP